MASVLADGSPMQIEIVSAPASPAAPGVAGAPPPAGISPIEGGEAPVILDGITADIGEQIAVVLVGDGQNGVFVGRLASATSSVITLALTVPVGPIPAGTFVAILRSQIAAAARVTGHHRLDP